MFKDKTVLIVGGTGSFGRFAVRELLKSEVGEVRVFSRDEEKQLDMKREFEDPRLKFFIGDVKDYSSLLESMRNVDLLIHAAALKIIPVCEEFPVESVKTNLLGTLNVKKASMKCDVPRNIFLSTDKAVNPVNVYGACKMLAEKIWVSNAGYPYYCCVRYGNVVGSRGSVIPFFKECIKLGKPLLITHPNMTRFFITLHDAWKLICHAVKNMFGGEIFVPKLKSCRITVLAGAMRNYLDGSASTFKITHVRRGEKIHETLISEDEFRRVDEEDTYYIIQPPNHYYGEREHKDYNSFTSPRLTDDEIYKMVMEE